MSMITRCPACATAFRVTESQLRARSGQVRCGRCGALFDALAALSPGSSSRASLPQLDAPPASTAPMLDTEKDAAFDFGPRPHRRSSRMWWLGSAFLVLALAAQVAYRYRGEIAVLLPEAKPLIQRVCAELGCDVPLPRRVELLGIESSDLQADSTLPSVMVLTATLRNRASGLCSAGHGAGARLCRRGRAPDPGPYRSGGAQADRISALFVLFVGTSGRVCRPAANSAMLRAPGSTLTRKHADKENPQDLHTELSCPQTSGFRPSTSLFLCAP